MPVDANNITGIVSMMEFANYETTGWFIPLLLISIFAIMLINLLVKYNDPIDSIVLSSFVTSLCAIFLRMADLVNDYTLWISIAILIISSAILFFKNK